MLDVLLSELDRHDSARFPCVYQKGMILFMENDPCTTLGVVLSGAVKMSHYRHDGSERVHAVIRAGAVFGDFLIFSSTPYYPGHLTALEESVILHVPRERIETMMAQSASFRHQYLRHVSEKALELNDRQKLLGTHTLEERLLFWLAGEQRRLNTTTIPHNGQETLAGILHVQRPSLSRTLNQLRRQGKITYDRHHIIILEPI
ncbi:MAG: Crp/Fnr family transcriptional regulator [Acholeplasmatales bacterium]|nr:MAG: Crp/Fnr family transcriptional regulator [Acholeplasmatales bacterium]